MNTADFANAVLTALADLSQVTRVELRNEGPIVSGRAFVDPELFLAFYYNQATATQTFALIKAGNRVWGIDCDTRGWHLHPATNPTDHTNLEPQDIPTIFGILRQVLDKFG